MNDSNRGIVYLLMTSIIFGFFGVIANGLNGALTPFTIVFVIYLVQSLVFGGIVIKRKDRILVPKKVLIKLLVFGLINSFPILFFNLAASRDSIGSVLLLQNLATIAFSFLYSLFILKEKLDYIQIGLVMLAMLGVATIYIPSELTTVIGAFFAVCVGIFNAGANIYRKELSGASLSPYVISVYSSFVGLFVWGLIMIISGSSVQLVSSELTYYIVGLLISYGLLNVLTTFLLVKGFALVQLTIGNLVLLMEIVFGGILGYIVLGQQIGSNGLIGSLIVLISVFLIRLVDLEGRRN